MSLSLARPESALSSPPATEPRRRRRAAMLPVLVLSPPVLYALHRYGAPAGDLVLFGAYVLGLIAAPGVLLWRAGRGRARSLAEDFGPGLALGYAVEILAYFAARAAGLPRAVVLAPILVLVLFAVVRPLRRYCRAGPAAERAPLGWIWATSGITAGVLLWSALYFMRTRGVDYPFNDADLPFQLALIGELRHHMPPAVPWVLGEPLSYHWFAYADLAATTWVTGIDPPTLLLRLYFVPLLGALPFAVGALARQVTGRWWPGPLAALMTLAGVAPYPYSWAPLANYVANGLGPVDDGAVLRFGLFSSPTQTFAALLGIGLTMVLVDLLRGTRSGRWAWLTLGVLVAAICGSKATYLPLILCGLLAVVGLTLLTERRWHRGALGCLAVVVPGMLFAQFVLFHGESQGMVIEPLNGLPRYSLGGTTGLGAFRYGLVPTAGVALAVITAITILAWATAWGGAAVAVARGWRDPAHVLLAGFGVAAFGAVLLLNHFAFSQTWFLVAARPYLAVLAVAGLAALVAPGRRGPGWWPAGAIAAGLTLGWLIGRFGPATAPTVEMDGLPAVLTAVTLPNLALIGVVAAVGGLAALAGRRCGGRPGRPAVLVVALMIGMSLQPSGVVVTDHLRAAAEDGYAPEPTMAPWWPAGTRAAAAWMRAHSAPDDLVATNAHCRRPDVKVCDNLHFSFAAFTERRFLVEGWGYTPTANRLQAETGLPGNVVPYWDQARLAINDAAFHRPGPATLDRLRRDYGVRWLFVDERDTGVRDDLLGRYAMLRYRSGQTAVYQVR